MSKLFACICIFLSFSVQASEIAGWDMQLVSCQNYDKFVFAGDVETYTGEIEFQTMEQTPSQDNIFVLCELKAEKKAGEEPLIAQSYKLKNPQKQKFCYYVYKRE